MGATCRAAAVAVPAGRAPAARRRASRLRLAPRLRRGASAGGAATSCLVGSRRRKACREGAKAARRGRLGGPAQWLRRIRRRRYAGCASREVLGAVSCGIGRVGAAASAALSASVSCAVPRGVGGPALPLPRDAAAATAARRSGGSDGGSARTAAPRWARRPQPARLQCPLCPRVDGAGARRERSRRHCLGRRQPRRGKLRRLRARRRRTLRRALAPRARRVEAERRPLGAAARRAAVGIAAESSASAFSAARASDGGEACECAVPPRSVCGGPPMRPSASAGSGGAS